MLKNKYHIKICEKVYLVARGRWGNLKPLTSGDDCNVFLVDGGSELVLIEAGNGLKFGELRRNIKSTGGDLKRIKKILITHGHWDHTLGIKEIKKKLEVKILAAKCSYEKFPVDGFLKNGQVIRAGGLKIRVRNIPGHTPDSMVFIVNIEGKKIIFTGDTAIGDQKNVGKGIVGWYDMHWGSNLKDFKKSIRKLIQLEADMMIPSHGKWHSGKKEVKRNLKSCFKRLGYFDRIPQIGSMIPL